MTTWGLADPLCGLTSLCFLPYFPYEQIECMYIWDQVICIKYVHNLLGSYHLGDIVDVSDHTNSCHNDRQQAPPQVALYSSSSEGWKQSKHGHNYLRYEASIRVLFQNIPYTCG